MVNGQITAQKYDYQPMNEDQPEAYPTPDKTVLNEVEEKYEDALIGNQLN